MAFNKAEYRKRRSEGKRGQGDYPETSRVLERGFGSNRARYRQKLRARYYENEDDTVGKPFTKKGVKPNPQKKEKFSLRLDPTLSNKQRFQLRKQRREMILEDQRKERENGKSSDIQA